MRMGVSALAILAAFIVLGAVATYLRERDWEKYQAAHGCVAIDHRENESGGTPKTRHTIRETQWRCEGDDTFWRED